MALVSLTLKSPHREGRNRRLHGAWIDIIVRVLALKDYWSLLQSVDSEFIVPPQFPFSLLEQVGLSVFNKVVLNILGSNIRHVSKIKIGAIQV